MMRSMISASAVLALAACGSTGSNTTTAAPVAAVAPPKGGDWTTTVVATPEGGFLMGNPNAPVKLLEYGSVTCPVCQAFATTGFEPLTKKYVASGKVSFEFRSFLIHGPDVMASTLLQCAGPEPFFALLEANYAGLNEWEGKLTALPKAELERLQNLPPAQQTPQLAQITGLDQFVIQRGVSSEAVKACLADPATPDRLLKQTNKGAQDMGVTGTPTFFINGTKVDQVVSWRDLEPQLRAAGA